MRAWAIGLALVTVALANTARATKVSLVDDGVGVFKTPQVALNGADERQDVRA